VTSYRNKFRAGGRCVDLRIDDVQVTTTGDVVATLRMDLSEHGRRQSSAWHARNLAEMVLTAFMAVEREQS
jgi:hypothetical protein